MTKARLWEVVCGILGGYILGVGGGGGLGGRGKEVEAGGFAGRFIGNGSSGGEWGKKARCLGDDETSGRAMGGGYDGGGGEVLELSKTRESLATSVEVFQVHA